MSLIISFGILVAGFGICIALILFEAYVRETPCIKHLILTHKVSRAVRNGTVPIDVRDGIRALARELTGD